MVIYLLSTKKNKVKGNESHTKKEGMVSIMQNLLSIKLYYSLKILTFINSFVVLEERVPQAM